MQSENEKSTDLRTRTKQFALRIIRMYPPIAKNREEGTVLGRQLLRSGTSVGAHYREACRARSIAEFISKLEGGLQELDETQYWLELLDESSIVPSKRLSPLLDESKELIAMFIASINTAKRKRSR